MSASSDLYTQDLFETVLEMIASPSPLAAWQQTAQAALRYLSADYVGMFDSQQQPLAQAGTPLAATQLKSSWENALHLAQQNQTPSLMPAPSGGYAMLAPCSKHGTILALGQTLNQNSLQRLIVLSQALAKRLDQFTSPILSTKRSLSPEIVLGQDQYQARLLRLLSTSQTGRGAAVLIQGGIGSGKTTLAKWLLRQASQNLYKTLRVQAEIHAPLYQIWRTLLQLHFPNLKTLTPNLENYRLFLQSFHPDWGGRAGLLLDVMQFGYIKAPALQSYKVEQRRAAALTMLIDLLHHSSREQPLLMVVEDAQHLDEASQYIIEQFSHWLMSSSAPMILCVTSTDPLEGNFHTLELTPLNEGQVQSLIRNFGTLPEPIPAELAAQVAHSPWYAQLLTQYLSSISTLAQLPSSHPSHQEVLQLQLQQLPVPLRLTLFACAAVGSPFALATLQAIHPERLSDDKLMAILDQLNGWLEEIEPNVFIFQHLTAWAACQAICPPDLSQQLHLALAQHFEQERPLEVESLAYHYGKTVLPQQAQTYLIQAANAAHARGAYQTALELIAQALTLVGNRQNMEAFIILTEEADLYHALAQYDREVTVLQELSAIAQNLEDAWLYADHGWRWLRYYHATQQAAEGIATWHLFQNKAQQAHHTVASAEISITTALLHQHQGDYATANRHLDDAAQLAQRTGNMALGARILFTLGQVFQAAYEYDLAQACLEQSIELYRQRGDQVGIANSVHQLGHLYETLGYYTLAAEHYDMADKLWMSLGSWAEGVNAILQSTNLAIQQKNHTLALTFLRKIEPVLPYIRQPILEGHWWYYLGRVQHLLGNYENSLQHFRRALEYYPANAQSDRVITYAALAQVTAQQGQKEQSEQWLSELETLDPQLMAGHYPALLYLTLYESLNNTPKRQSYLTLGQQRLLEEANKISDQQMRMRYLTRPDRYSLNHATQLS